MLSLKNMVICGVVGAIVGAVLTAIVPGLPWLACVGAFLAGVVLNICGVKIVR